MNRFEKWFLRRLCRKQIVQGVYHAENAGELTSYIIDAWVSEFMEDNVPTHKAALFSIMGHTIMTKMGDRRLTVDEVWNHIFASSNPLDTLYSDAIANKKADNS